ncbi:hypothetical protein ABBQ38_012678 [Trebouxia sp. C0009 RCD-2024]
MSPFCGLWRCRASSAQQQWHWLPAEVDFARHLQPISMISMPGAQCCLCLRMLAAYMEVFIAARCSLIFDTLRPGGSTLTACQLAAQDQPTHNTGALRYDC